MSTFSYSGDPNASRQDWVRFEIQDTDPNAQLLTDAEIRFCVAEEADANRPSQAEMLSAAARALEVLARKFAAQADETIGSLKINYSASAKGHRERAMELRVRAAGMHSVIWGGHSESQKEAEATSLDRVQPAFTRNQFTNPWKGAPQGPGPVRPGEGPV